MSIDRREFVLLVAAVATGCSGGPQPKDAAPDSGGEAGAEPSGYVIAQPCIGVKDTACVDVCPVDCIHPGKDERDYADAPQLYIDPAECIHCSACVPACPVEAVFAPKDVPPQWKQSVPANRQYYSRSREADVPVEHAR
jgi:NAD-dependent dihydropyrimidine dehydrogenase PreA subunit